MISTSTITITEQEDSNGVRSEYDDVITSTLQLSALYDVCGTSEADKNKVMTKASSFRR
jgi:hypothetical protein